MMTIQRARPGLGTMVEITVQSEMPELNIHRAVNHAFQRMQQLHNMMSFHESGSDIARINQTQPGVPIQVAKETWEVLFIAQEIAKHSQGVFDITVATQLMQWGILPCLYKTKLSPMISYRDIELLKPQWVCCHKPLVIDVGGIAKGYIVDVLVDELKAQGIKNGLVNAGGDMRAFGTRAFLIQVRNPTNPAQILPCIRLQNRALATSARYFSMRSMHGQQVNALVNPHTNECDQSGDSISVLSDLCVYADAFTKIAFVLRHDQHALLAQYHAEAFTIPYYVNTNMQKVLQPCV